ncbi:MAG: hypothetical protein QXW97_03760 [Candidatus Pacearchaeota archaeon]
MKKISKKNIINYRRKLSYLEIVLLITSVVSFSYLLSDNMVNAAPPMNICCEKLKSGAVCQNVKDENECDSNFKKAPTECKDTDFCSLGCCISSSTGICNINTPKAICPKEEFKNSPDCNINECKKGCCILGDSTEWTTEKNCQHKADFKGITADFNREIKSEIKCLFFSEKNKLGACILDSTTRKCLYTTLEECNKKLKIKGDLKNENFYEGKFCSDKSLNTSCTPKSYFGCQVGKEDVYYFDSCNNPEDIKQDCNIFESTYCGKVNNAYTCKDISCNTKSGKRKNGESWCEYDEVIGNGKDMVGSRHVRHYCYMGEEKIEPCADYRNEICVQEDIPYKNTVISQSACRINNWRSCFSYNSKKNEEMSKLCNENPDCYIKEIDIDDQFKFKICLPKYPPGFKLKIDEKYLTDENYKNPAEEICGLGSQECTVIKVCTLFGCRIVVNENCLEKEFTQKMNDFCVSLGDCGGYVNFNNDVTQDGYIITSDGDIPPRLSNNDILNLKKNSGKKPALPGNLNFLGALGNLNDIENEDYNQIYNGESILERELQAIKGAMGSPLLIKILTNNRNDTLANIDNTIPSSVDISKFSNAISSIKAGISSNYELRKILGLPASSVIAGGISAVIGAGIGYSLYGTVWSALFGASFLGLLLFFLFFSKIEYIHVNFKCLPWQPPIKGNCDICNNDLFCTEYRCSSLGQNCELINKGTGNELCISKKTILSLPIIKPWKDLITPGFEYYNVNDNGFEIVNSSNKGCIPAFTNVKLGIQTLNNDGSLQYTQCKLDMTASKTYDEMADFFNEIHQNSYLPYHRRSIVLPSPDILKYQFNATPEQIQKLKEIKFYIKCKNLDGIENPNAFEIKLCVDPAPDLTPPYITKTIPENGAKIKYGINEINVNVFVNEPANCKWSKEDKSYNEMENFLICNNYLGNYTIYGFSCFANFNQLKNNTKFYIRCQDLSDNKNNMTASYIYELSNSKSELLIKNIYPSPGEEIYTGTLPFDLNLRLETSGGAEDGKSICMWEGNGFGPDLFTQTNSSFHSYQWKYAISGDYNLNFKCEDIAGNIAENSTFFSLILDDSGPKISRIFNKEGLKIITNENAECRYSFNKKFLFENSSIMSGNSIEHVSEWKINNYNIQCIDNFGNKGNIFKIITYK